MNTSRRTLRWVIAHHPARLFVRTAEKFRLELEKECPGEFDIEIYTMSTYQNKYNNHPEFSLIPPNLTGLEEMQKEWPNVKQNTSSKQIGVWFPNLTRPTVISSDSIK